jgi:predicted Zn-dependent protease with MMP-like domain
MFDSKHIIMNFNFSPSLDDLGALAGSLLDAMPEELAGYCENLTIRVEDFPDTAIEQELELEDSYELLALFRSGKEISPGVEKKTAAEDDLLILFRRPLLDMWCEGSEDLSALLRHVMIEEIGRTFDFSEEEIEEMTERHYQGML